MAEPPSLSIFDAFGEDSALLADVPIVLTALGVELFCPGDERVLRVVGGESVGLGADRAAFCVMSSTLLAETGVDKPFS